MATAGQIFVVSLAGMVVGSIGYRERLLLRSYIGGVSAFL
jgi:hypothetical protein